MKLVNIIKITVAGLLTTSSLTTYAGKVNLSCPTANLVSQVSDAMDNAIPDGQSYIVTSKPVVSFVDHLWSVRTEVPARSQDDAIKLAQITVKETKALMTPNAIQIFNQYGCIYFSARAYVYALTQAN